MMRRVLALVVGILVCMMPFAAIGSADAIATVVTSTGTGSVNLREGPGNYDVIGKVRAGSSVDVISKSGNWYRVKVLSNNKIGYIYKDFVSTGTNKSSTNLAAKIGMTGSVGRINRAGVALRSGAGNGYKSKGSLSKGTKLVIRGKYGNWYKVTIIRTTPVTGYVPKSYVSSGIPGRTTTGANLREGGSSSFASLATIPSGYGITILSVGSSWSKVRYGKLVGFISNYYINFK